MWITKYHKKSTDEEVIKDNRDYINNIKRTFSKKERKRERERFSMSNITKRFVITL